MEKGNARTPPRGGEPRMTRAHPARRHVRAYPILKMPPRYRMKSGRVYPHGSGMPLFFRYLGFHGAEIISVDNF